MTTEQPANRGGSPRSTKTVLVGVCAGVVAALFLIPWIASALTNDDKSNDLPSAARVIDGIETDTPDEEFPPQRDLDPGAMCTVDTGGLRAAGSVTNHAAEAASYRIEVEWENEGFVLDRATSFLDRVEPQATAKFEVVSTSQGGTAASTCRVKAIDRTEIDG